METNQKIDHKDMDMFLQLIKRQDRIDEQYLIKKKIVPVIAGLILLMIVFIVSPITNPLLFSGSILVYLSLLAILVLFFLDYRKISREAFDVSLKEYIINKKARMESWKSTPKLYNIIFLLFVIGVVLIISGNTNLIHVLNSTRNIIIYILSIVGGLLLSGIFGECMIRKRFKKQHLPLITTMASLLKELNTK
jgi:hypothetical protein